jgi:hypothetical protein
VLFCCCSVAAEGVAKQIAAAEEASLTAEETAAPSARSSTSSAGDFEGKEEWRDASAASRKAGKHPSRRLSLSSNDSGSVGGEGRGSLCSTMRVSFCSDGSSGRLSAVPPAYVPEATTEAAPATAPAAAPAPSTRSRGATQHPLADLLDDALQRGLVVPQLTRRMEVTNHTKYVVETQVRHSAVCRTGKRNVFL